MANGYMPRKDAAARAWLINFAQQLGERPGAYKATQQEADVVRDAVEAFVKALRLAVSPDTRTSLAVLRKDERRQAAELACRPIYLRVKFDPTISNEDKFSLGVRLVNPSRTRIGAPDSAPVLRLQGLSFSGHSIGFADAISPTRRGKPFGATQLQLFRRFEDRPAESMQLVGCFTRGPIQVDYDMADNGRTVVYQARWMTRRGEVGPWSNLLDAPVVALAPLLSSRLAA